MVANHLSRILGEKRWSQAKLAKVTGIRAATINELYNDIAVRISLENLDRICEALDCGVADIFEYIPNRQRKTGKDLIAEDHGNRSKLPADRR